MKAFIITFVLGIIIVHSSAQKSYTSFIGATKSQDAFHKHLKVLSLTMNGSYNMYDITVDSAVRYMERVTHLRSHGDCQYVLIYFTWLDLALWKDWYATVGSKRIAQNFKTSEHLNF